MVMGCGTSKNDVVKSSKNNVAAPTVDKNNLNSSDSLASNSSVRSEGSTIPAYDSYQNNLNNESDKNLTPWKSSMIDPPLKPPRSNLKSDPNELNQLERLKRPDPVAFEVPAEEGESTESTSIIKRHPPRRLRKTIEEQQQMNETSALTQELLIEKVELANERRNQALNKRAASARQKSGRVVTRHSALQVTEDDENHANGFEHIPVILT